LEWISTLGALATLAIEQHSNQAIQAATHSSSDNAANPLNVHRRKRFIGQVL